MLAPESWCPKRPDSHILARRYYAAFNWSVKCPTTTEMRIATRETTQTISVKAHKTWYGTKRMPYIINFRTGRDPAPMMNRTISSRRQERNKIALICSRSTDSSQRFRRSDRATRRAASKLLETRRSKLKCWSRALVGIRVMSLCSILSVGANAQVSETQRSALSPPINHESGRVEEVISAADDGYHFRGYVLTWRSMRIVVAGTPDESHVPGDNLNVVVYRSDADGRRILRFESNLRAANDNVVDADSTDSRASITFGTARIEDIVSADSNGYRFVGYFVMWHDQRVFVVDPQSLSTRAIGDTINFRVLRTELGANQRLSFSL
jgi:hypothetical protein